jgi:hypothetical protein
MTPTRATRTAAATLVATVAVVASSLAGSPGAAGRQVTPAPGAPGVGDRLYPRLGNGGYDALHYSLRLRYATRSPSQPVDGTVRMVARSTRRCPGSTWTSAAPGSAGYWWTGDGPGSSGAVRISS